MSSVRSKIKTILKAERLIQPEHPAMIPVRIDRVCSSIHSKVEELFALDIKLLHFIGGVI